MWGTWDKEDDSGAWTCGAEKEDSWDTRKTSQFEPLEEGRPLSRLKPSKAHWARGVGPFEVQYTQQGVSVELFCSWR